MASTSLASVSTKRLTQEREQSLRVRVVASPNAQRTPGEGGTSTGQEPMSLATALACSDPAPPKLTRAKSRGS